MNIGPVAVGVGYRSMGVAVGMPIDRLCMGMGVVSIVVGVFVLMFYGLVGMGMGVLI